MIPGRELNSWCQMYIDDITIGEVNAMERAKCHFTDKKEKKIVHAYACEINLNIYQKVQLK